MNRCKKCGIMIADKTKVCPLCQMVLSEESGEPSTRQYPNVTGKRKTQTKVWKVITFILVMLQMILVACNVAFYHGIRWSLISGAAILYLVISLYQLLLYPDSLVRKLFWQTILVVTLLLGVDVALGFRGWSVQIGIPCVVLCLDVIVLVCMIVQFRNWQNYLLLQMFTLFISVWGVVLWYLHKNPFGILSWVTFSVTALFFAFCVFFGSTKAKNELRRRFYI